jgi:effector-binding domain-containing protein
MTQISIKTKLPGRNKNYKAVVQELEDEGYEITGEHHYPGRVTIITNAPRNFVERIDFTRSAVQIRG